MCFFRNWPALDDVNRGYVFDDYSPWAYDIFRLRGVRG